MSEAEHFLQDARKSFHLAAGSIRAKDIDFYAELGRDYLQLAHDAAKTAVSPLPPSWWNLP